MEKLECRPYNLLHAIIVDAQQKSRFELNNHILYDLLIDAQHLHNFAECNEVVYYCLNKWSSHIITEDKIDVLDYVVSQDSICYRVIKVKNENYDYIAEQVNRNEIKF